MKNEFKILLFCMIGSLVLITGLFYYSGAMPDNGFKRQFNSSVLTERKIKDLQYNSWYIAGNDNKFLYLGNYVAPDRLLIVDLITLDTSYVKLIIESKKKMEIPQMFIRVDSPYIYLLYGNSSFILRGKIDSYHLKPFIDTDLGFHAHFGLPVSKNSFIVKTYDSSRKQYILSKISKKPPFVRNYPGSLLKQVDGIFSTEGLLGFDQKNGDLVFTYVYRNAYTRFDTALNILSKGHTVDTNLRAKIKIAKIESADQLVFAEPRLMVNKVSCISHHLLFVNSDLKANNEKLQTYRANSVVDIYDLTQNRYMFSFYVPDFQKAKLSEMLVLDPYFFVLQGRYLIRYRHPL
ncbi:uncharacterized protein YfkK (UPF0435 family) [Pedobacter cryoconitis]|uniref:hypothetical protein n=1 Tax=Pedobacter cryoconitis TaxID=188932 RepID=UPI00161C07D0|nr:hypothetical protein [Pedobacter cryoconitis]MBB6271868.1 uncharacterized protein YfkK (UPF0435 family) [Pedobacter cryoconitis]